MRLLAFADLTEAERRRFLEVVSEDGLSPAFTNATEMESYLTGPAFEMGSTYVTFWDAEVLACCAGVVVREIAVKGEAFLTMLHVFARDADAALALLLQEAYAIIRRFGGADGKTAVKIGFRANDHRLQHALERAGGRPAYRILDMVRSLEEALPAGEELQFRELTSDNLMDYLNVHNAAFLHSPNGAQMTPTELEEMCQEAGSSKFLQVGYAGETPAAVLEVDVRGEIGQIQAIGVAPAFQRRGLGRAALARALQVVAEGGAQRAHLQVVDVNTPAVELYRASGFLVDQVLSTWYDGPTLVRFAESSRGEASPLSEEVHNAEREEHFREDEEGKNAGRSQ